MHHNKTIFLSKLGPSNPASTQSNYLPTITPSTLKKAIMSFQSHYLTALARNWTYWAPLSPWTPSSSDRARRRKPCPSLASAAAARAGRARRRARGTWWRRADSFSTASRTSHFQGARGRETRPYAGLQSPTRMLGSSRTFQNRRTYSFPFNL